LPLKAKLNGSYIFSFNYDHASWVDLKNQPVYMHCCDSKAILKKSKLGTLFFSHHRKGECNSAAESAEHIYLKNLISSIALRSGWEVETEHQGETPDGERWVADVYCVKGNAKLVFEVQWSHQANDEFIRRQKKYISSGVRAAWLFKLKGNKEYWNGDIPYRFDTPVFGMKFKSKGVENLYISQFDEPVEPFVEGVLHGKLNWSPQKGERLTAEVIPHYEHCWRCKKETGIILGVSIKDTRNNNVSFEKFSSEGLPELILSNVDMSCLAKHNIGMLKTRYSKTRGERYLSNGCIHCDALMGDFFVSEALVEYWEGLPDPIDRFEFRLDKDAPKITSEWYFDGRSSKHLF